MNSDAIAYMPMKWSTWNASAWGWALQNGSSFISRATMAASHAPSPTGASKYMIVAAGMIVLARAITVHLMTRTALAQFGHAHSD